MVLNGSQKERLYSLIKKTVIFLAVGLAYFLFVQLTGIGIPCMIKLVSGKYCPGCGVSRMLISILKLDFAAAAKYNYLLFCLLPLAIVWGIRRAYLYVKYGNTPLSKTETVILYIVLVLTIAFWILRNTETFSYLAPNVLKFI